MKVNGINVVYSRPIKKSNVKARSEQNIQFRGDKGRTIGSILGAAGALVGVTALSAIGIGLPLLPIVAAGIAAKAGGDAGDKYEQKKKNESKGN